MSANKVTRYLAVAAKTGQICCVLIIDDVVQDWRRSRKGAKSNANAAAILKQWLLEFKPDVFISENPDTATRKGERQRENLKIFATIGTDYQCLNMVVSRRNSHKNKYEQARAIAKHYPEIKAFVPVQPPIWKPEPRAMIYFEALSLFRLSLYEDDG